MVKLHLRFLQSGAGVISSNPVLLISGKIQPSHKTEELSENQALTCSIILYGITTLCKTEFAERCWQQGLSGNGKARTPVPGGKKRFCYLRKGQAEEQELTGIILTSLKHLD